MYLQYYLFFKNIPSIRQNPVLKFNTLTFLLSLKRNVTNVHKKNNHQILTYPSGNTCGRLLQKVPYKLLILRTLAFAKLFLVPLRKRFRLLAHFLKDVLLALVVLVLATGLQVELVHTPVLQVIGEGENAHFVH